MAEKREDGEFQLMTKQHNEKPLKLHADTTSQYKPNLIGTQRNSWLQKLTTT